MSASASLFGNVAIAGAAGGGGLNLTGNGVFGGVVAPTTYLPLASTRMQSSGQAQKAGGSTQALLVYTNITNEWHTGSPTGADFEIYFDTVTNTPGGAGNVTWAGSTRDAWIDLGTTRTWTLQKNTTSFGSITWQVLIEIREISNPSNTTGVQTWSHTVQVDL